jgi:parallel beta-helix repeat protein
MSSTLARRSALGLTICLAALTQACGGGGGTGGNPTSTIRVIGTRTPTARVTGGGQVGTPTPTVGPGTPQPTATLPPDDVVVVFSGEDIAEAARNAPAGSIIAVAPGLYAPVVLDPGDLQGSITLLADTSGELTSTSPAPVTVVGRGDDIAAFEVFSQADLTIDGFTLRGGTDAALLIADSLGVVVRNCTVTRSDGDAILIERSDDVLVFNNVLAGNGGSGVALLGSRDVRAINNTVYNNAAAVFASIDEESQPSANLAVLNNILHQNSGIGVLIDTEPPTSLGGYEGDFNLNTDDYQGASRGPSDIDSDPLFIFAAGDDFHLAPSSPAVDRGTGAIDGALLNALVVRSTQPDGALDALPVDLGYHYVAPMPTPTRRPRATSTPQGTATRTGGATPTRTGGSTPNATATSAQTPTRTRPPTSTPKPTRTRSGG